MTGFGDRGGLGEAFQLCDPRGGGRPLLPLGHPQSVQSWGLSLLGLEVLGQRLTPSTEAPRLWDLGVGPQGTLGLKGSLGVWGVHVARGRTAQGNAWQMDGRNAGIRGNLPGQYTQGALHSVREQPAFQESLCVWRGRREACWGDASKPRAGFPLQGSPPRGLGLGVCRQ